MRWKPKTHENPVLCFAAYDSSPTKPEHNVLYFLRIQKNTLKATVPSEHYTNTWWVGNVSKINKTTSDESWHIKLISSPKNILRISFASFPCLTLTQILCATLNIDLSLFIHIIVVNCLLYSLLISFVIELHIFTHVFVYNSMVIFLSYIPHSKFQMQ